LARLEAALFVAEGALSARRLAQVATLVDAREVQPLVDQLNGAYDQTNSAFRIERVAAGYQMLTRSELSSWLDRIHHRQERLKLSVPAMETLAIISYRQPCTRADVEEVRGVQSAEIIKQLMERNLVRVIGEDDSLGRPYLYGTTRLFLETFGLTDLDSLPMAPALRRNNAVTAVSPEEDQPGPSDSIADAA
jgi:segregation and condensation protein B